MSLFLLLMVAGVLSGAGVVVARAKWFTPTPVATPQPVAPTTPDTIPLVRMADWPVKDEAAPALAASISAQAYFVMDLDSGAVLTAKNEQAPQYPASTTKLMTALVAFSSYPLDQVVTIGEESLAQGNTIHLLKDERITVQSLLTGLLVQSGNDAAFALANAYPFGYQGFVLAMNNTAAALGMTNSAFTNPSGLDDEHQYMSARDLAVVARAVVSQPLLKQFITTKRTVITGELAQPGGDNIRTITHPLGNTNELLGKEPAIAGGKTGTTPAAGEVLVSLATVKGHEVIIVMMGSEDRYVDTKNMLRWLNQAYEWLPAPNLDTL